jgi:O-antigen/teichoic acid export membrane protein
MSNPAPDKPPIRAGRELAVGSAWMIAMRWAIRGVGLLSTIILARLLAPDDFGVLAMAMVAVAILQSFTQSGVDLALLRAETPKREHYDAAWTLEIIQGVLLTIALFLAAPLVAGQFEDPRVTDVIRGLSLAAAVGGFQNIGVVDFRRNLDFRREFLFGVYKKFATFGVTVTAAVVLRDYWALVIGQVAGRCIEVLLSYRMSSFRPRLSLARVGEIWGFSQWLVLSRITMLVNRQFDRWVVGSIGGAATMGNYFVAQDFASSPSDEVVAPMSRAAFPVYSRLRSDPAGLADALRRMLASVTAITFATGLGIAAVATDFVHVVLGARWAGAIPMMPWLGLFAAVYGIVRTLDTFLIATGGERTSSLIALSFAVLLVPVLWYAGQVTSIEGIAATKALTAFALVGVLSAAVTRCAPVSLGTIWTAVWPPMLAALAMFVAVKLLQREWPLEAHLAGLIRDVLVGALVYSGASVLVWQLRGRPAGIEQDLIDVLRRRFGRRRGT